MQLSQLDDRLGLELGEGLLLNHLAFADDVALVSSSPEAMGKPVSYTHLTLPTIYSV